MTLRTCPHFSLATVLLVLSACSGTEPPAAEPADIGTDPLGDMLVADEPSADGAFLTASTGQGAWGSSR